MSRDTQLQTSATDVDQLAHAQRKEKDRARRRFTLLRQQLSTPDGREFVWQELERHGLYQAIYGPVEFVYTQLGRRAAGLELLADLQRHPQAYLQMQNEAIARDEREARENQAARTRRASDIQEPTK